MKVARGSLLLAGLALGPSAVAPVACVRLTDTPPVEKGSVQLRPVVGTGLVGGLQIDAGLRAAAEELIGAATRADARLEPGAVRLALARAGYPRAAHFLHARSADGSIPTALLDAIPKSSGVDVGWASRPDGTGGQVWIVGWALQVGAMDPLPRDVVLDRGVPLRVDGFTSPRLYVGSPDGRAQELGITDGVARWLDLFHLPGEYRVEVVEHDRVAFLFSLFVEAEPAASGPLPGAAGLSDPLHVAAHLAARVNELRVQTGLRALTPFSRFELQTRAQATCLASLGVVAHKTPGCPGVPAMTAAEYYPQARHHEDVVAADTAEDAWEWLYDSPGHRMNLLCSTCTHLTVGSAVENTDPARVFAVIEVMEFPQGEPVPIIRGRR